MRANGASQKWTPLKMLRSIPQKLTAHLPSRRTDREVDVASHGLLIEPRRHAQLFQAVEHGLEGKYRVNFQGMLPD